MWGPSSCFVSLFRVSLSTASIESAAFIKTDHSRFYPRWFLPRRHPVRLTSFPHFTSSPSPSPRRTPRTIHADGRHMTRPSPSCGVRRHVSFCCFGCRCRRHRFVLPRLLRRTTLGFARGGACRGASRSVSPARAIPQTLQQLPSSTQATPTAGLPRLTGISSGFIMIFEQMGAQRREIR